MMVAMAFATLTASAQAAQKFLLTDLSQLLAFAAAQAAQKLDSAKDHALFLFAAAQAAQKKPPPLPKAPPFSSILSLVQSPAIPSPPKKP